LGFGIADLKGQNKSEIRNLQSDMSDFVQITVKDTGIGIPPEDLPHIFDRFYQAGDAYAKDTQGTGIGLALTKELVELHHGEIEVSSEVGKGTTFTVRLPLGKEHLQPEEIADAGYQMPDTGYSSETADIDISGTRDQASGIHSQSPNHQITKSPSILIVEDNPDMRTHIRELLDKSPIKLLKRLTEKMDWQKRQRLILR
jgi:hypothetical protein